MQFTHMAVDNSQRELTPHGTTEFPLAVYMTQLRLKLLGYVEWHWHNELQLCLVTQGIIGFEVGDYTEILRAGEGIFINASIMHKASNAEGSDGAYICLDFHTRYTRSGRSRAGVPLLSRNPQKTFLPLLWY